MKQFCVLVRTSAGTVELNMLSKLFCRPVAVVVSIKPIHSDFIVVRHDTSCLLIEKLSLRQTVRLPACCYCDSKHH